MHSGSSEGCRFRSWGMIAAKRIMGICLCVCRGHMCMCMCVCVGGGGWGLNEVATSIMRVEVCVCALQYDWPLYNGPSRPYCFRLVLKSPWQQMWCYTATTKAH